MPYVFYILTEFLTSVAPVEDSTDMLIIHLHSVVIVYRVNRQFEVIIRNYL
jgi:hypothetical protein